VEPSRIRDPRPATERPRALIVEDGFQRGSLAAARALGQAGWRVGIGSPKEGFASTSRATSAWHRVPSPEDGQEGFVDAVRKVVSGSRYISPELAESLATALTTDATRPLHATLSDREFAVLRLIASGQTVGEIADRLSLSVKTVSTYRARILEKMRLKNNAELMQYVLTNHLLD